MNDRKGIAGLRGRKVTLEERIEAHLKLAPTDTQLADDYVDPADRQNVRHRALISAVLDAYFEDGFSDCDTDIIEVEVGQKPDVWSELANARSAFNRDAHRVNNGNKAENCLSPAPKESIIPTSTIGADRELLIVWLATIEVWEKTHDGNRFKSRKAVFDAAANASGTKSNSYKTNRSTMKHNLEANRFSQGEKEMYEALLKDVRTEAAASNGAPSAFDILFTAARVLSERKAPVKLSADKLKG